jgi:ATP-dependent exoDNAse (exonuclease V) beta subunit
LVEVWPLPPKDDPVRSGPWQPPVGRRFELKARQRLIKLLARRIQRMTSGTELLESRGRADPPGDVMVLVRRRGSSSISWSRN